MKKWYEWFFKILLVLLTASLFGIVSLAYYPYKPLEVKSFVASKDTVTKGCELCYTLTGEKFYNMPVDVTIELIDGESVAIMNYTANMPKGEIARKRCFIVPYHVKAGKYRINWTGVYTMNALNHIRVRAQSQEITVK